MKRLMMGILVVMYIGLANKVKAQSMGQDYTNAIGVKLLDGGGITYKHFLDDKNAIEGIGFFWNRGTRITGLYEIHHTINGVAGLKWYIGTGSHDGFEHTC